MSRCNPMRWDCETQGCFNKKRRPKIEMFADCFPGSIMMGDVDGMVEINGHFIFLEWKTSCGELPKGQRIAYQRMGRLPIFVLIVVGDAETMAVERYCSFWKGEQLKWEEGNLGDVKARLKAWAQWAQQQPRPPVSRLPVTGTPPSGAKCECPGKCSQQAATDAIVAEHVNAVNAIIARRQ